MTPNRGSRSQFRAERQGRRGIRPLYLLPWVMLAVLGVGALVLYLTWPADQTASPAKAPAATLTPSPALAGIPTGVPTRTEAVARIATAMRRTFATAPPTPTLPPGRARLALVPSPDAVGWVCNADTANHLGDGRFRAGVFEGNVYHGAAQFNLEPIPLGAKIERATVELAGVNLDDLGSRREGAWVLCLLGPEASENWDSATYEQIHHATVADTIGPELAARDLVAGSTHIFTFTPSQCEELERRLETGVVSFRLDGPSKGPDNLLSWEAGAGRLGGQPVLHIVYQPPATLTPIVVTATPTPANILTAAAMAVAATERASARGPSSSVAPNMVTATPPLVIVPTVTPGNAATAQWVDAVGTAQAILHGTPTPLPAHAWTATPVPTPSSTPSLVVVNMTHTPTPHNVLTVAAIMASIPRTPTPFPPNWVTPFIITNTPTPGSNATAQWMAAVATAQAFLRGTPTPLPSNLWTATAVPPPTPTPLLIPLDALAPRSGTRTPTPTPSAFPSALRGKILFRSDRLGGSDILAIDADGSNVALLTNPWAYHAALAQRATSPDGGFVVYQERGRHGLDLFLHDLIRDSHTQLTHVGTTTAMAYDAAWSPHGVDIVFASNQEGDDEIFAVSRDGGPVRQLTHNDWEWDKHPDYSPDGEQVVYCSNALTHRTQIWVMNADGSDKRNVSDNAYNDWDPVWIKSASPQANLPPAVSPSQLTIAEVSRRTMQTGLRHDDLGIRGSGFQEGLTVFLRHKGRDDILAHDISLAGASFIRCKFDLTETRIPCTEQWSLHVVNADGQSAAMECWLAPPSEAAPPRPPEH